MKNKTTIGLGLLALAAAAAWYYWRQRSATAATDASAAPDSPFNRSGQIGSNFNTDVTPELVAFAWESAQKAIDETKPCWDFWGVHEDRPDLDVWCQTNVQDGTRGTCGFFSSGSRPSGRICKGN